MGDVGAGEGLLQRSLWIIPVILAITVFSVGFNNYFVYDDFIWLYRAKSLGQNWKQIFYPDVMYFDPLIYLSFFLPKMLKNKPRLHAVCLLPTISSPPKPNKSPLSRPIKKG